jgi:hypothetical protein
MKTSHSEPVPDPAPEELVPALSVEVQERDPSLIALVRNLAGLEMRLAQIPPRPVMQDDNEIADIVTEMNAAELGLRKYAEELAISRKVDRYTGMLAYLEGQRDALVREVSRLTARKRAADTIIQRMLGAAHYALHLLPKPLHGPRELEGSNSSLVLVSNPGRVHVTNQEAVPPIWRRATIKMTMQLWFDLLNAVPEDFLPRLRGQYTITDDVMLSALAPQLKSGMAVAGAEWVKDDRVERR